MFLAPCGVLDIGDKTEGVRKNCPDMVCFVGWERRKTETLNIPLYNPISTRSSSAGGAELGG